MTHKKSLMRIFALFLTLIVCVGCGGSGAEDGSGAYGSGISPYIQSETQADTGPDILRSLLYLVLADCTEEAPELTLRDVRRALRDLDIYFDGNLGAWTPNPEQATLAAAYLRSRSFQVNIVNGEVVHERSVWKWGLNRVAIHVSLDLQEFYIVDEPNPNCAPVMPISPGQ